MSLNPILFANQVNQQFIRYQFTAFPISDPDLSSQAKDLFSSSMSSDSPFFKGPYVSLSRPFALGDSFSRLSSDGILHPGVAKLFDFPNIFRHQQDSLSAIKDGNHCLLTTGTGSGKTESFLLPIIDHCFHLRDSNAPQGIVAIIIYPMNALASDQLARLRHLLAGTGISFGMYVGTTPQSSKEVTNIVKMNKGEDSSSFSRYFKKYEDQKNVIISPWEERISREDIVSFPPRILLTNPSQLEFLLTRGKDTSLFIDAPLKYLVLDEAHSFTGAIGSEVACLLRRLRSFCGKSSDEVICVATSATIADTSTASNEPNRFMQRLFGIDSSNVSIIYEKYSDISWSTDRSLPKSIGANAPDQFARLLTILETEDSTKIVPIVTDITGLSLEITEHWQEDLYNLLLENEFVKIINDIIKEPIYLYEAVEKIFSSINREITNIESATAEILIYLTLGAVAGNAQGPLLRPKLHIFIRGLRNASVIFNPTPTQMNKVELFFSADKAFDKHPNILPTGIFPILVCMNCGQHFFETYLSGITNGATELTGGYAEGFNVIFPRTDEDQGVRFLFTNNFVVEDDEETTESISKKLEKKRLTLFLCRFCGTIHKNNDNTCSFSECSRQEPLVPIYLLNKADHVSTCPSCSYKGGSFGNKREPFRPLRAVTTADVHILAQELINKQRSNNRKIIIFSDNRQDAAFQASWIAQRARRYRFRHMIYQYIKASTKPVTVGDITDKIFNIFKEDRNLAYILAQEVFSQESEEAFSNKIQKNLKKYIRIVILQELTLSMRARASLETYGLAKVVYNFISYNTLLEPLTKIANLFHIPLQDLILLIENLLDKWRRSRILFDPLTGIYTRYWNPGDEEIQRGFLSSSFTDYSPLSLKLTRESADRKNVISPLISNKLKSAPQNLLSRMNVDKEEINNFLTELWHFMTKESKILIPVDIVSNKGKKVSGTFGVYQINIDQIGLVSQSEKHKCNVCLQTYTRPTPQHKCLRLYCQGSTSFEEPSADDYDINLLQQDFSMIVAKEHTAQVPPKQREEIESEFKDPKSSTNCIVASPTMELGVDIGALDIVLMRNVPPLPSNYWQRAGRAGRKHRLAVIYTYCRKSIHDDYFFEDPTRILNEKILTPKFNLKNPVMIRKHVHASIISQFYKQNLKSELLDKIIPNYISDVLFEPRAFPDQTKGRKFLSGPLDLDMFKNDYQILQSSFNNTIKQSFQQHWPEEALDEISEEILEEYINDFISELQKIYNLLYRQLMWASQTRGKINRKEESIGTLEDIDRKIVKRCNDWINNIQQFTLDNYSLARLSQMGFLPSYNKDTGNITAFADYGTDSFYRRFPFELRRPSIIALSEYAPGNLIYANGGKYRNYWFHLSLNMDESSSDSSPLQTDTFLFDLETEKIYEKGTARVGYAEANLQSIEAFKICDLDLYFFSLVSDDENYRFRMISKILGYEKNIHRGGKVWKVNNIEFHHLLGLEIRLINIGSTEKINDNIFGFPVCLACGQTRSPFASEAELTRFVTSHKEKSCNHTPQWYGLLTDARVDGLIFKGFSSKSDAINFCESIIMGASGLLEMNRDDLSVLVLPQSLEEYNILLFDPMVGGSGLLDQIIERWQEIIAVSLHALNCPNQCKLSCYRCLRTYRNMPFHMVFDRINAIELIKKVDISPKFEHSVPPTKVHEPIQEPGIAVNQAEHLLREKLRERGFPEFEAQKEITIDLPKIKSTTPDFYYEDPSRDIKIAIYLDGLSKTIHGNTERQNIDRMIRSALRIKKIQVVEISASELHDQTVLDIYFNEIASYIYS